jgi:hypothetical protein
LFIAIGVNNRHLASMHLTRSSLVACPPRRSDFGYIRTYLLQKGLGASPRVRDDVPPIRCDTGLIFEELKGPFTANQCGPPGSSQSVWVTMTLRRSFLEQECLDMLSHLLQHSAAPNERVATTTRQAPPLDEDSSRVGPSFTVLISTLPSSRSFCETSIDVFALYSPFSFAGQSF